MKRITSFILTLIIITAVAVYPAYSVTIYTDGDYSFTDVDSENVALYNYTGESDVLVIPEQFSGRMVSEVYDYAFENNTALTALDFSQNGGWLKNLGVKCFAECTSLTGTLNLPSSIRKLGLGAFQGCTGLSSLTINIGVRDIPRQCFNRCTGLQTVYLPSDLETIDDLAFGSCDYLDKVYIPRSVSYISSSAFARSYPTLCVYYKSYAHQYAIDNNIRYTLLDGVKLGDVDGDGDITITDATAIQRYLAELETLDAIHLYAADANEDKEVDIADATAIQMSVAKIPTGHPIGEVITK